MSELAKREIRMPSSGSSVGSQNLTLRDRVLVIIGANGSGKTRLGCKLEKDNGRLAHRVSAHRSLVFPENVRPMDLDIAERMVLIGRKEGGDDATWKLHHRWSRSPEVALLNDFDHLVTYMVSESFSVSDKYRVAMKASGTFQEPPATRLDIVKEVWESVLPTRRLVIDGSRIRVSNVNEGAAYHAKEMSDGERGIFHLIGEALSVPKDGVFIVDEPELHLHRAIQARLWDAVESARTDCTFVYITHDLGFAASRKDATKVWLREYVEGQWDWEEVPETDDFPEPLLLEVLGSRRPILFVEGERSSLDLFVYGKVFSEHTVVPCGSCELVIHSACSFAKLPSLHHNKCAGMVDNDGRSDSDIQMLQRLGVAVLPVALVENLFLLEPILQIACAKLGHDSSEVIPRVKDRVFSLLEKSRVLVASNLTRQSIETALRTFGRCDDGAEAISASFSSACGNIDPADIYSKWDSEITRVLSVKDYVAALRIYKIKGLPSEAGNAFGMRFQDQVMRWLRGKDAEEFVSALRAVIPVIPERSE